MLESKFHWISLMLITTSIEWFVLKFVLDESSKLKSSKLFANLCFVVSIIAIILMTAFDVNVYIKLFISLAMTFIIYKINYDTTILKCIVITLLYWMLIISFDALGSTIVIALNKVANLNILLQQNVFRLELIILTKSLLLMVVPVVKGIKLYAKIDNRGYLYISIPILANILSIVAITGFMFQGSNFDYTKSMIMFTISFILLLSNISLVILLSRLISDNEIRLENKIIIEKMNMQYEYYSNLQKFEMGTIFETKNLLLDVLLTEKKYICDANNIEFSVDVNFSKCLFMDITDVCCIFANIIDISMDECKKIRGRHRSKVIKISGDVVNNYYVIKCESSKPNITVYSKDTIITDDQDETVKCGICINSIKKSVKKYRGELVISSDEALTTTILIPMNKRFSRIRTLNK
ncbi:GHKL domain-containing protein [Metaclostridioides mangenotii]|uniref:GHKL domain-containing protein n=1 Tax=Metaclostridioides mangenotii TaxID=1540 RepID=UPI000482E618|nr:GHKL domain-containing protein [Clostridioides mangenotii]